MSHDDDLVNSSNGDKTLEQEYRELIDDIRTKQEDLIKPDCEDLTTKLKKSNELFERVTTVREGALDSKLMSLSVSLGVKKAAQMQTDLVSFQALDFMEKLVHKMGGTLGDDQDDIVNIPDEGWSNLIEKCSVYFNLIPSLQPLLGVCNMEKKIKIIKRHEREKKGGEKSVPTRLTKLTNEGKEATPEEIERVLQIIQTIYQQDPNPIDYFELVVNPESFGQTIENVFHVAFLVKDGHVKISLNEDGLPVLVPVKTSKNKSKDANVKTNQIIISLSMQDWKEIVETFELEGKEPYIKAHGVK